MKSILLIILTSTIIFSFSTEKNCSYFKTGRFRYKNSNYSGWIVTRKNNIQIESNKTLNLTVEGTVKWKSECEYELTYTKAQSKNLIGKKVFVKITNIKGSTIMCNSICEGKELNLEMEKID